MAAEHATTATAAHPAGGGHGGFPPFQSETFAGQLLWLALTFGLLYLFLSRIGLPRLGAIIEARHDRIAGDLDAASAMKKQAEEAGAAYETALAEARKNAQAIAQGTRATLAAETERQRKSLEADLAAKLAAAEATITGTKRQAMASVEAIATEAAAAIVERLIGQAPAAATVSGAVKAALRA